MKKHVKNEKTTKLRDILTGFMELLRKAAGIQSQKVPVLVPIPYQRKAVRSKKQNS